MTLPTPLPSVFNTPLATPGSPALHFCDPGRGPWISLTWYGVLGVAIIMYTSAVTVFVPPVPTTAVTEPTPAAGEMAPIGEKSQDR